MIEITNKEDCCGCSACEQICPKECISMQSDSEGFLYPVVDESRCVECGRCENVCLVLHPGSPQNPLDTYAAINYDEEARASSSSGGMFVTLAERIIDEGGVVFGARFDKEWQVELAHAETKEEAFSFRGSKYVQANPLDTYKEAKNFLKSGRKVLFSGTPCQIAGLKHFLQKDYENLLTVDFICHGIPSPKVWRKYLQQVTNSAYCALENVGFRNKENGWKRFCFDIESAKGSEYMRMTFVSWRNQYMQAFLQNMILRPSCYGCPAKSGSSSSDITIADFWGVEDIHPDMDDDKGTSLVMVNTSKGREVLNDVKSKLRTVITDFQDAVSKNSSWYESSPAHPRRSDFFRRLNKNKDVIKLIEFELTRDQRLPLRQRIKQRLKRLLMWNVCS